MSEHIKSKEGFTPVSDYMPGGPLAGSAKGQHEIGSVYAPPPTTNFGEMSLQQIERAADTEKKDAEFRDSAFFKKFSE